MKQDELKRLVGQAAANYVVAHIPAGEVIGVGTGSTANCFIDALADLGFAQRYRGAVSSSVATTARLNAHQIPVLDLNQLDHLPIYIDGADEIDAVGHMIKGGGGALTREKIVAMVADVFVCIADASKRVEMLGGFALPIEVVPLARAALSRKLTALKGEPVMRMASDGTPYITENGHQIIDVKGLQIADPVALEAEIGSWPGVVTVGLFAKRHADMCLLSTDTGVQTLTYPRTRLQSA